MEIIATSLAKIFAYLEIADYWQRMQRQAVRPKMYEVTDGPVDVYFWS
jgi:hypothetical protein